tara:strand:+ start:380 stop:595 length:216 start_codon:yes stop_codon:yes gene_type:complete
MVEKTGRELLEAIDVVATIIHKKMDEQWLDDWLEEVIARGIWNPKKGVSRSIFIETSMYDVNLNKLGDEKI